MSSKREDLERLTYAELGHAVQSGVSFDQAHASGSGSPKHLRTGLDLRAADAAGLARLLIAKGVFTEAEYLEAIRRSLIDEVMRYESSLSRQYGTDVTLR